jgi:glycerate 2-kinase
MLRHDLLDIYRHALAAVEGRSCVRKALIDAAGTAPVRLVALGKAAGAMAQGAFDALGTRIDAALIVTGYGHPRGPEDLPAIRIEAAHPVPDRNSLAAGQALLDLIGQTPPGTRLLFLISGGTSSLVEVPRDGIDLEDLQRAYRWLLGSGLPIAAVNRIRTRLSCIKGGRLAASLHGRRARQLLISDVPGDDPATIGSGLLSAAAKADSPPAFEALPDWLQAMLALPHDEVPAARAPVETQLVATIRDACVAAEARARSLGYRACFDEALLAGDAIVSGQILGDALRSSRPGLTIRGGETVVRLPESPGRGGRCQSLALAAALVIAGREDLFLLAAGSDGLDGTGGAAGALVDGGTIARGSRDGLDATRCLQQADAGRFLDLAGDLIYTGPGNTNVMDLVLALSHPAGQGRAGE